LADKKNVKRFPSPLVAILLLLAPAAARAVAPASPASCRPVTLSKLGEHLRETVWEITRTRTLLNRALQAHHDRCEQALTGLQENHELTRIEEIARDASKANAKLQDLGDEYLRTAETASRAAHLLGEEDCERRIRDQRKALERDLSAKSREVHDMLDVYCR
jgi:hypothetical protein